MWVYRPGSCWCEYTDPIVLRWAHRPRTFGSEYTDSGHVEVSTQTLVVLKWVQRTRSCCSEYSDTCHVSWSTQTLVMLKWVHRPGSCWMQWAHRPGSWCMQWAHRPLWCWSEHTGPGHSEVSTQTQVLTTRNMTSSSTLIFFWVHEWINWRMKNDRANNWTNESANKCSRKKEGEKVRIKID